MPRKTLVDRCKSTLKGMKARAKKTGHVVVFTADDLVTIVPELCPWCRQKLTPSVIQFDHLLPLARGGDWTLGNLQACCGRCNRRKSILTYSEYRLLLRKLREMQDELGDSIAVKNVLMRLAAGAAFIYR